MLDKQFSEAVQEMHESCATDVVQPGLSLPKGGCTCIRSTSTVSHTHLSSSSGPIRVLLGRKFGGGGGGGG